MAPTEPKLRCVQFLNSIVAHSASLFPVAQGDSKVKIGGMVVVGRPPHLKRRQTTGCHVAQPCSSLLL